MGVEETKLGLDETLLGSGPVRLDSGGCRRCLVVARLDWAGVRCIDLGLGQTRRKRGPTRLHKDYTEPGLGRTNLDGTELS